MTKRFHMSRRTFLKVSAVGAVVLLGGGYLLRDRFLNDGNPSSTATDVIRGQRLPIPNLLTGTEMNGKQVYDLIMQPGSIAMFLGNKPLHSPTTAIFLVPRCSCTKGIRLSSMLPIN